MWVSPCVSVCTGGIDVVWQLGSWWMFGASCAPQTPRLGAPHCARVCGFLALAPPSGASSRAEASLDSEDFQGQRDTRSTGSLGGPISLAIHIVYITNYKDVYIYMDIHIYICIYIFIYIYMPPDSTRNGVVAKQTLPPDDLAIGGVWQAGAPQNVAGGGSGGHQPPRGCPFAWVLGSAGLLYRSLTRLCLIGLRDRDRDRDRDRERERERETKIQYTLLSYVQIYVKC